MFIELLAKNSSIQFFIIFLNRIINNLKNILDDLISYDETLIIERHQIVIPPLYNDMEELFVLTFFRIQILTSGKEALCR